MVHLAENVVDEVSACILVQFSIKFTERGNVAVQITPITTRKSPLIISLTMLQRMPKAQRTACNTKVRNLIPKNCVVCLMSANAVISVYFD